MKNNFSIIKNQKGSMLVVVFVATNIFIIITMGVIGLGILQQKLNVRKVARAQALHIAEAGVNYYRWVLYHNDKDYCNNETCISGPDYGPYGPYEYKDSAGKNITGYYELYITPPQENGSTIINIKSVGWVDAYPNIKRSIEVQCGIPSWASFSTLANDNMRFGEGTEVWGPIHSNGGIRFDGLAHNLVTSLLLEYEDPDHTGDPLEYGVHTHIGVGYGTYNSDEVSDGTNPPDPPIRNDVFLAGRSFPTTTISFNLLDNYANTTYALATSSGIVFDPRPSGTADAYSESYYWGCENAGSFCDEGFYIKLKTNNTFEIRGVSSVEDDCHGDPSLSIASYEPTARTYNIPANGIVFVKHNVWIDGQIDGSRINILAFSEPFSGGTSDIIINNDLLYTNYDGTDSIGLIAQRNIGPGLYSEGSRNGSDDGELRIDASLIAKDGRIGRYYYPANCDQEYHKRNTITVFGSMATYLRYGFSWACGMSQEWCSGYETRNLIYDNNLTFAPPPHFPTTGEYTFISWKEE